MEGEIMKALSVRAPWWWFILNCGKDVENRTWKTDFRGRILLHASKTFVVRDLWSGRVGTGRPRYFQTPGPLQGGTGTVHPRRGGAGSLSIRGRQWNTLV